jgi:hypothetical protein
MTHVSYPHKEIWKKAFIITLFVGVIPFSSAILLIYISFVDPFLIVFIPPILYAYYYRKAVSELSNFNKQV